MSDKKELYEKFLSDQEWHHSRPIETAFFAGLEATLTQQPESEPAARGVDHDDCSLCGGCQEIETTKYQEEEPITVPCPECMAREIEASVYTTPQPSTQVPDPITPKQCPFIDDEDSEEACNGYADGWNDCVKTMLRAPSIAEKEKENDSE